MKVRFCLDSTANIHSCREQIINLDDYCISEKEWKEMTEDERFEIVEEWANNYLEIYWEEI